MTLESVLLTAGIFDTWEKNRLEVGEALA